LARVGPKVRVIRPSAATGMAALVEGGGTSGILIGT